MREKKEVTSQVLQSALKMGSHRRCVTSRRAQEAGGDVLHKSVSCDGECKHNRTISTEGRNHRVPQPTISAVIGQTTNQQDEKRESVNLDNYVTIGKKYFKNDLT